MKTLRVLPVVLIGAVVLGSVGCSNPLFSESLVDDFEITETSTEDFIGKLTTESDLITSNIYGNSKDLTAEPNAVNVENGSKNTTPAPEEATNYDSSDDDHSNNDSDSHSTSTGNGISSPAPTLIPTNSPSPTNTPIPTESPSNNGSGSPTFPTNTPVPTATSTPKPTNTPVPTSTPTPEPTEAPEPTPQPAVAARIRVTLRVWGSDDPEGEDNDVSVIVYRTYTVQPKDGCTYHSYNTGNYVAPDMQINTSDINSEFYAQYPNGLAVGYAYIGDEIVGFVDD